MKVHCLLLSLLLFAGCSAAGPTGPPEIRYGEEECSRCRMIVGEPRFAAAARLDQEVRIFDDLGELFETPLQAGEQAWVHDAESGAWIDARAATYVRFSDLKSPMGYGLLAFADQARARVRAASQGGTVLSFQQAAKR